MKHISNDWEWVCRKTHGRICLKNSMHFKSWWCERARFFFPEKTKILSEWKASWLDCLSDAACCFRLVVFHLSCTEHTLHETSEAEWNLLEHEMLLNSTWAKSALTLTCVCVYGWGKSQSGEAFADTQIPPLPPPRSNSGFPRHNTQYVYENSIKCIKLSSLWVEKLIANSNRASLNNHQHSPASVHNFLINFNFVMLACGETENWFALKRGGASRVVHAIKPPLCSPRFSFQIKIPSFYALVHLFWLPPTRIG